MSRPAQSSLEETEADECQLDAIAEAEIGAARGIPHEQVREWLMALREGKRLPIPTR